METDGRNGPILQDSTLNFSTLVCLDQFIGYVVNYVDNISRPPSTSQKPRTFQDTETVGFIPASRRGNKITPGYSQVKAGKRLLINLKELVTVKGRVEVMFLHMMIISTLVKEKVPMRS